MPRVSKAFLQKQKLTELENHFSFLIASLQKSADIEAFMNDFLTHEEKIMLTKRLVLFMMLKQGYSPSAIQAALHVSYETVRTYTNHLAAKSLLFHATITKLLEREETKKFWQQVEHLLKPLGLAMKARSNMRARAKLASGNWD